LPAAVSPSRSLPSRSFLLWFGVLGAPFAWTLQHVAGFAITVAACNAAGARWDLPVDGLTIAVTATAAAVAVLAEASALHVYRVTRDAGDHPPASRVHFLSIVGLAVGPLFLAMVLMSGLGATVLPNCQQG
jgi:hypothetical protein